MGIICDIILRFFFKKIMKRKGIIYLHIYNAEVY